MGYFDALTSSVFKTASDGRKLFFPWGVMGNGYVVVSEQDYQRLRRQCKAFNIVGVGLILATGILEGYLWGLVITALLVAFYIGWARYQLRGLQPSNESLSLNESMTSQAITQNVWVLWLLTVISLVFFSFGIGLLIVDPRAWATAILTIGFSSLCIFTFLRMLVLRRRAGNRPLTLAI